jgi:multisubunit Na+/H+ antiporter MnhG subunit
VVRESLTQPGINAIAVGAFLLLLGPVQANATARAIRLREVGQIEAKREEQLQA